MFRKVIPNNRNEGFNRNPTNSLQNLQPKIQNPLPGFDVEPKNPESKTYSREVPGSVGLTLSNLERILYFLEQIPELKAPFLQKDFKGFLELLSKIISNPETFLTMPASSPSPDLLTLLPKDPLDREEYLKRILVYWQLLRESNLPQNIWSEENMDRTKNLVFEIDYLVRTWEGIVVHFFINFWNDYLALRQKIQTDVFEYNSQFDRVKLQHYLQNKYITLSEEVIESFVRFFEKFFLLKKNYQTEESFIELFIELFLDQNFILNSTEVSFLLADPFYFSDLMRKKLKKVLDYIKDKEKLFGKEYAEVTIQGRLVLNNGYSIWLTVKPDNIVITPGGKVIIIDVKSSSKKNPSFPELIQALLTILFVSGFLEEKKVSILGDRFKVVRIKAKRLEELEEILDRNLQPKNTFYSNTFFPVNYIFRSVTDSGIEDYIPDFQEIKILIGFLKEILAFIASHKKHFKNAKKNFNFPFPKFYTQEDREKTKVEVVRYLLSFFYGREITENDILRGVHIEGAREVYKYKREGNYYYFFVNLETQKYVEVYKKEKIFKSGESFDNLEDMITQRTWKIFREEANPDHNYPGEIKVDDEGYFFVIINGKKVFLTSKKVGSKEFFCGDETWPYALYWDEREMKVIPLKKTLVPGILMGKNGKNFWVNTFEG